LSTKQRQQRELIPIHFYRVALERTKSFKLLGVHFTINLKWSIHRDNVMKAQQRLLNLRRLKKFGLSCKALMNFYRCTIERIL
jgi:hypothetical protein